MSVAGFLFQGAPVPPQPTGSDTQSTYPLWLQQYDSNLASAATNLASQSYTPYPGQQVATPSAPTVQAQNMALGNVGNYQPALNTASNFVQAAGTPVTASQINQYMSPYESNVVGALQQASNTNLNQNVLPSIQDRFVSAGQSRSPQEMQATNNAVYQSNQSLNQATSGALQSGYQGALNEAMGEQGLSQAAGATEGQLGALTQQLGAGDVGQVAAAGQEQDINNQANINASMNNFNAQQQWPYQNLAYASNIIRGQTVPSNTQTVGLQPSNQTTYSASPLQAFTQTAGVSNALGLKHGGSVKRRHAPSGALSLRRMAG